MALLARNEGLLSYLARHGGRKSPLPGNLAKGRIEMHAKIALFAAALLLAAPVSAKPSQAPAASPTPVSFADLDLATDQGVEQLNRRILAAARSMCPVDPGLAELSRHRIATECIAQAQERTNPQIAEAVTTARLSRAAERQVAAR
jgi:UrcA family protein